MNIKHPNPKQMDFLTSLEHEDRYSGENRAGAVEMMCMDAIIKANEFPQIHIGIFARSLADCKLIGDALLSMAKSMRLGYKFDKKFSEMKFILSRSRIRVFYIRKDIEDLWRFGGAEFQLEYFFNPEDFDGDIVDQSLGIGVDG